MQNKAIELGFKHEDFPSLARELGIMVAEHLGGVVTKEAELTEMWRLDSWELKNKAGSIVLPLGTLRIGLCRHRALLFKVSVTAGPERGGGEESPAVFKRFRQGACGRGLCACVAEASCSEGSVFADFAAISEESGGSRSGSGCSPLSPGR